jgi:hypothetical protein
MVSTETGSLGLFPDEPQLTPHLDDFSADENPLLKAQTLMEELLDATCEVPLSDINTMATTVGVDTTDLLAWATKSETCFVDWSSGHIRCQDEFEDVTQTEPPLESPPSPPDIGGDDDDDEDDDDGYTY